ncbi:MAG: glucosamine/galactosamine-6-phosphate isomerase [Fibrobacteres bacterium]|nr:glucosamine/galactosamine-6-phosphate isomerase [Fibrobacterota bacterium]
MHDTAPETRSKVERWFLAKAPLPFLGRHEERIPVVMVDDYVQLGQLTALRFLEWLQDNPEGLAALPTGKTPEYFIKWARYYLANWEEEARSGLLKQIGLDDKAKPSCAKAHFVQLDEFFPIDPSHERSFRHYVKKYYLEGFGFDESRALLLDCYNLDAPGPGARRNPALSRITNLEALFQGDRFTYLDLRERQPATPLEALQKEAIGHFDRVCEEYERRIRSLGGIGFFLGGVGPDGHIAFNVRGSSHHSSTRLTLMNYETMAAAAGDLGGIESVRKKAVITIGLETITWNPEAVAIIMAAGEAKAKVVAQAIEEPADIATPASCLQSLPNARFFVTKGAASRLKARRFRLLGEAVSQSPAGSSGPAGGVIRARPAESEIQRLVIDGAMALGLDLKALAKDGLAAIPGSILSQESNASKALNTDTIAKTLATGRAALALASALSSQDVPGLAKAASDGLMDKIQAGLRLSGLGPSAGEQRFLHTGPHHDDIELAYFPLLHHLVRSERNYNHFCYLTSGFTSVTNHYVLERLGSLRRYLQDGSLLLAMSAEELSRDDARYKEIYGYLNAIAERDQDGQALYTACRLYRFLRKELGTSSQERIHSSVEEQIRLLESLSPGKREPETMQKLKGWLREWEAELVWAHFGFGPDHVTHMRLEFYTGAVFPQDPEYERDVLPIVALLEKVRPTVVTLALDPEGSGPDTHFKVLMAISAALETYTARHGVGDLRVWGYRNVWARFHPSEVNTIIPVSLNSFAVLNNMFESCFISQRSASFPSPELDGTFSELCQATWVEQFRDLTTLLGKETFYGHAHPMMRRAYGAIYLKDMTYAEFVEETRPLKALSKNKEQVRFPLE